MIENHSNYLAEWSFQGGDVKIHELKLFPSEDSICFYKIEIITWEEVESVDEPEQEYSFAVRTFLLLQSELTVLFQSKLDINSTIGEFTKILQSILPEEQ